MRYIACGLVANLDLVGHMNQQFYEDIKVTDPVQPKSIIHTWEEFCHAVCWNRDNGSGAEYIVEDESILTRLEDMLQWQVGIGGTGLQTSYAASYAGYHSIVNIPIMSDELEHIVKDNHLLNLAVDNKGDNPKHYIIEYSGQGRSNRLIFRKFNEFKADLITDSFVQQTKELSCDWLLLSGYHAIDNSEDIDQALKNTIEFLESVRSEKLKVHLELASIWSLREQWKIVETLRPYVDSVGLNEEEFAELIGLKKQLLSLDDVDLLEEVEEGYSLINISNLILHTKQFSLVMSKDNHVTYWDHALESGNKLAFSRAMKGDFCNREEVEQITSNAQRSDRGVELREFAKGRDNIIIQPGFVGKTVSTIGLGDTFTAGLLAEAPSTIPKYEKDLSEK
jgi:ADP-dependent phosphofructokinase/glucokinase